MAHDGGLTDADVVEAYRIFLEREPESAEAVAHHRAAHADRASLYRAMLASSEFLDRVSFPAVRAALHGLMSAPPPQVQHDAPPEVMARMVARIRDQWTRLGEAEPHWSVVTAERFRARNLAADPESLAFFRHTGAREAGLIDTLTVADGYQTLKYTALQNPCNLRFVYTPGTGDTGGALLDGFEGAAGLILLLR